MYKLRIDFNDYNDKLERKYLKSIQSNFDCKVVGYIMNEKGSITREDASDFLNVLQVSKWSEPKKKILLILDTYGGVIEPVLQIISLLKYYSNKEFDVFVPRLAKSAGTMMCLGASKIYMGLNSEIGPVDTQIEQDDKYFSAKDYCAEYDRILEKIKTFDEMNPIPESLLGAYYLQLEKFDNVLYHECYDANQRVIKLANDILNNNLAYNDPDVDAHAQKIDTISKKLVFGYMAHEDVINFEEAQKIGLNVEFLPPESNEWSWLETIFYAHMEELDQKEGVKQVFTEDQSLTFH